MILDLLTLVVVLIVLCTVIGVSLATISGPRHGSGSLWYWAMALLALAGGSLVLVARQYIPMIVSIMLGNTLIVYALVLLGRTASSMAGTFLNDTHRWLLVVVTGPFLGLLYFAVDPIWPRVAYMAVTEAYIVGQLAWQVHWVRRASKAPPGQSLFAFEVLLWGFLAESVFRTSAVLISTPGGNFFAQGLVSVAFLLSIVLVALGTCILIWHEMDIKDSAIRLISHMQIESGLVSREIFLDQLDERLAARGTRHSYLALMRIEPLVRGSLADNPHEEVRVHLNSGTHIAQCLDPRDLLTRFDEAEFGILFRTVDGIQVNTALKDITEYFRTSGIPGENSTYRMLVSTAVTACDSSIGTAAKAMTLLESALATIPPGSIENLALPENAAVHAGGHALAPQRVSKAPTLREGG